MYDSVVTTVRGLGFEIFDAKEAESTPIINSNSHLKDELVCKIIFNQVDLISAVTLPASLKEITGVTDVAPNYQTIDSSTVQKKTPWYLRPITAIAASTFITFITVTSAITHLKDIIDPHNYIQIGYGDLALIIGVPTTTVFLFQFLNRYHSKEVLT
jgi:hypothetical protein